MDTFKDLSNGIRNFWDENERLKKENADYRDAINKLTDGNRAWKQENEKLEKRVEELESDYSYKCKQAAELQAEVNSFKSGIFTGKDDTTYIEMKHYIAAEAARIALEKMLAVAQEELDRLRRGLTASRGDPIHISILQEEKERVINGLKRRIDWEKQQHRDTMIKRDQLQKELDALKVSNAAASHDAIYHGTKHTEYKDECSRLREELTKLQLLHFGPPPIVVPEFTDKLIASMAMSELLAKAIDEHKKEIKQLRGECAALRNTIKYGEVTNERLRNERDELREENERLHRTCNNHSYELGYKMGFDNGKKEKVTTTFTMIPLSEKTEQLEKQITELREDVKEWEGRTNTVLDWLVDRELRPLWQDICMRSFPLDGKEYLEECERRKNAYWIMLGKIWTSEEQKRMNPNAKREFNKI